jgi:WD40 repeat protein
MFLGTAMYQIAEIIENSGPPSHVAEVSFHPSGSYFAVTYEDTDEVRIFDSLTRKVLQVLDAPTSQLDLPHGVLFTEKYLLVANAHDLSKPGTINVYRNDSTIKTPIQIYQTPFTHLREPHSLVLRDGRLVVSYAENVAPSGAIVSYAFNAETGKIGQPLDKTESWFSKYGDPKGLCFNADGTKLFVTFESSRQYSILKWLFWALSNRDLAFKARLTKFIRILENSMKYPTPNKNGIATFAINDQGKIARRPERLFVSEHFCRLENVDMFGSTCAVTDTANHLLRLYDLTQDNNFSSAFHTANFGKATPHAAKFSPDGRLLVISSLGRKIINQHFGSGVDQWESPREDKIFVLARSSAPTVTRSDIHAIA